MPESGYGEAVYNTTICDAYVYGVEEDSNTASGTISNIQEWIGDIELTGDIVIADSAAVVISCDAKLNSNGYRIIIEDGGYLNTRDQRLSQGSSISSVIIFT